jgi:hypothetical protein
MEHGPRSTGGRTARVQHDTDRPVGTARERPYAAVAVVVTIALVSVLIFTRLPVRPHPGPGQGPGASSAASATAPPATPTPTPLPADTPVTSIAMVSASDGWAIAAPAGSAVLLHYLDGRWRPSGDGFPGVQLTDLSMDAHDDGWAVGAYADQVTGVVLHYSGGSWNPVQTPPIPFAGLQVRAFSPSQALVLASLPKGKTGAAQSALLRYDNGAWTETASPLGITAMSVLAADDIWATCADGHILHEQGGRWTTYTIGGQASELGTQPLAINMLSESDGWAAGLTNASPQGMFLAHFDGAAWTRVQGPAATDPTELHTITMVSATEGWAGGDRLQATNVEPVALHYRNGQWETLQVPASGGIEKIVMVSAAEGWAAAGGGIAGLLHYQNGRWTPYQLGA